VRRELAVRTIFNLLGPLTNPAGARRQLIGVSDARFLETVAGALARLGVDRALVVAAQDGLDEISASAPTRVVEVNGEEIESYLLDPAEVRVQQDGPAPAGGTPEQNAAVTAAILRSEGAARPAPGEALALINAGAAIYAAGRVETIAQGVEAAREALLDGRAAAALERYLAASRGAAAAEATR
jgi:anthranilate phosphoribosyltransferase